MPETFVKRLLKAMELRDIKAAELAKKSGISKPSISQYMNGIYEANSKSLYKLSRALNVDPAWLMGHDVPMQPTNSSREPEIFVMEGPKAFLVEPNTLTKRDTKDVARLMMYLIHQLDSSKEALMFDGEPLDGDSKELLKESLENSLKMGKVIAKKKFTPDKYQK